MREISLSSLGLETVPEVSARKGKGWSKKTIQNRIRAGQLPAVVIGHGRNAVFLLRTRDVDKFQPVGQGARTDRAKPARPRSPRTRDSHI